MSWIVLVVAVSSHLVPFSPSFSEWMMSFLFSVLHIIYTTVYFILAQTWRHWFSVLHSLGFTSHVFASTDGNNEVPVLWPWLSHPANSQFGCDVGKAVLDIWKSLTPAGSWASCTVVLCRLQNYSLLTKAVAWIINAGIKMDREVERHLWEGQRHLPSQFLLPVSFCYMVNHPPEPRSLTETSPLLCADPCWSSSLMHC